MRTLKIFALATLTTVALSAGAGPASAMVLYPWCLYYGGSMDGAVNCGFTSFAQCQASRQGNGGICKANPWYSPYPPRASGARPITR